MPAAQAYQNFWMVDDKVRMVAVGACNTLPGPGDVEPRQAAVWPGEPGPQRCTAIRIAMQADVRQPESRVLEGMSLADVVQTVKPHILLGLSGAGGTFTPQVLTEMAKHVEQPVYACVMGVRG